MATIQSPPNSVWPNGLQTDSEGYVNFYPLGTNKVDISTITWPEGTEVKSPFVYQDDKLVGFIDTKALDIDNNDTTIDINYTHFDANLDSIIENTLTINAPANATVNVKYGAVDKVLTEKIESLIGKGKCEVKFDKDNNKATIVLATDTTKTQITEIENLLERVLPGNLVTDIKWADGLPFEYTRLAYLESTGTEYLNTAALATGDMKITLDFIVVNWGYTCYAFGSNELPQGNIVFTPDYNKAHDRAGLYTYGTQRHHFQSGAHQLDTRYLYVFDRNIVYRNGELAAFFDNALMTEEEFVSQRPIMLFAAQHGNGAMHPHGAKRVWKFVIEQAGTRVLDFIPAVNPEGQPGMYDTVSKVFKVNVGSGDFIIGIETQQQLDNLLNSFPNYTGQAIEKLQINLAEALQTPENEARLAEAMAKNAASPAMISIDMEHTALKFYAQLTEHGVRRLYHVPKGYTGTMDEYAVVKGFKELIEPPMPSDGYWVPEWHETDTQLILNWVETEPPTEEVGTLNNEN